MKTTGALMTLLLAASCVLAMLTLVACDDDNSTDPEPTATPTVTPIPSPTPTPIGAWGYIAGYARVQVDGLTENPELDKQSIFCMSNPDTGAWLNVRHRNGNKFQVKASIDPYYECSDEINYNFIQPAGNGEWTVNWDESGRVVVTSPLGGVEVLEISRGRAAWREVRDGWCGGPIPSNSPSVATLLELTGTVGMAEDCP